VIPRCFAAAGVILLLASGAASAGAMMPACGD